MWVLAVGLAAAKPCQLDLQVVFLDAERAVAREPAVAALDRVTGGLVTATLGERMAAAVYEHTRREVRRALEAYALAGDAQVRPAPDSGRETGWTWWDPATGVRHPSVLGASQLTGKQMLVVHLDDPRDAAIRVGGASPFWVDVGLALGVDVAEKVYSRIVYDKMQAPMAEAGLQALVNTGRGVRCPS